MRIQVLCGMIASGKSTYSRNAARQGMVVVNDDAITMAVHGGDYGLYQQSLKVLYKAVEHTIITQALAQRRDVVIDRPCLSQQQRGFYLNLAHRLDAQAELVCFPLTTIRGHAQRRFDSDPRGYSLQQWEEVARRHWSDFELPYSGEGWDGIYNLTWNQIKEGVVL